MPAKSEMGPLERSATAGPLVRAAIGETPFTTQLNDGSHTLYADEPASLGGADTGPTSIQMLVASLGACTAITLKMYAQRKHWPLQEVLVNVQLNPEGAPPDAASEMRVEVDLHGPLDATQRARLMEVAQRCPVHRILTGEVRIATVDLQS